MFMCFAALLDVDEWRDDVAMAAGLPGIATALEFTKNGNAKDVAASAVCVLRVGLGYYHDGCLVTEPTHLYTGCDMPDVK